MPASRVIGMNPLPEPEPVDGQDPFIKEREQMAATLLMAKKQAALRKYNPLKRGASKVLAPRDDPIAKKARNGEDDSNREHMVVEMVKEDLGRDSFLREREDMAALLLAAKKKAKSSKKVESLIPAVGGNEDKKEGAQTVKDGLGEDQFLKEREEMAALLIAAKRNAKSSKMSVEELKGGTKNESAKCVADLNPPSMDCHMNYNGKVAAIEKTHCESGNKFVVENARQELHTRPVVVRLTKEFPASDIRKMLVERARVDLGFKLETLKNIVYEDKSVLDVPDPEFHDFDLDRTRHAFRKGQVWACYDDDDGMPRYYAFVHKILSARRFKIGFSYLKSPSTAEFGRLSWIGSGFVKTLGHFRVEKKCEIARAENLFSHKVDWEKGPQGTIRVFPRCGEVWAVYKNWSVDWNSVTPDEVIHDYEMVEVLEEYKKDKGCGVVPLEKVGCFTAVYKRVDSELGVAKRMVKREEMLRFSHRVPAFKLDGVEPKDGGPVLDGCFELDPAALPVALVQTKQNCC